ncbi:Bug family tripartite tricarboxylate transporter substrate binding protein [Comamonas thiooxydans]|uniref:ABC transporter substrate-binding protein n=1 Tax=Comamonas thiooxydans TaxID=363952 RepID=A0A0E3BVB3_9BURK|nr:tripartite tricarboxylate transporter substrate binding protein [Comamonas thiooxydans]KGH06477.1 ABC transporter substrate-binding protein [Comamonas thiooxydans]KGH12380.1 ABC transporter substrate-binding protein [Comamonas thiooxydans]KGH21738.1 ABC transporter substrate-binding protein [Comamonas thiooxydans]
MPACTACDPFTLNRRQWSQWAAATALGGLTGTALAQDSRYPSKAIRMVIPFTPGGSADILGRAIGHELTTAWGQSVVPENVAGAGGSIGADRVAKASADGYTLLMGHVGTLAVTPTLYPKLPYDPIKSFTPLAWVARVPNVLVVHPSLPVNDLASFIGYAKTNPGAVNFSSGGNGSAAHMTMAYLSLQAGLKMQHVPYKGTAPAVNDLVAGQVQALFTGIPAVLAQIRAGQIKAIAVSSPLRIPALPNVPTVAEAGLPGFEADQWYGVVGPANMPADVVARINQQINASLRSPAILERLQSEGAQPMPSTPKVFADLIVKDLARWRKVIIDSKMTL